MAVVEVYYQMTAKDTSTVNKFWKAAHVFLFATIIVCDFSTAYAFGKILDAFGDNCILYANVSLNMDNTTSSMVTDKPDNITETSSALPLPSLNLLETVWSSPHLCSFCQFTPLMSAIFGIIWLVFFILCSRGGAGYPADLLIEPWRLVYPASIFAILFTIVLIASHWQLLQGLMYFCSQLTDHRCSSSLDTFTLVFHTEAEGISTDIKVMKYFGNIAVVAWVAQILLLLARVFCVADFGMHMVTVMEKAKEAEEHTLHLDLKKDNDILESTI